MLSSNPRNRKDENNNSGYSKHIRGAALGILVMGLSLAAVIALWATIGYQGSDYSTQVMEDQQEQLHEQYGLPQEEEISPELLEVPPSLRNSTTITAGDNATEDVRPT